MLIHDVHLEGVGLAKGIVQTRVGQVDVGVGQWLCFANVTVLWNKMNCHLDGVAEEGLAEGIQKTRGVDALQLVQFANVMVLWNMVNHQLEDVCLAEESLAEGIQKTREVDALWLVWFANMMVLWNMVNHHLEDVRLAWKGLVDIDMGLTNVTWLVVANVMWMGHADVLRKLMNHDVVRLLRGLAKIVHRTQVGQVDACWLRVL
jgi:hypothetical protein